jgi:hypothetical protein
MSLNLINTPEKETLKEKYLLLKGEYVKLLTDKECLLQCVKPQIEALYVVKIGHKQLKLLEIQLETKRLKKMSELAVAYLNRNEPIDWNEVSAAADVTLERDYVKIIEESSRMAQANELLNHLASPEHSAELRKLYRQLAKELHPDINQDLTEKQRNLWYAVKHAYEYGDLESLRALSVMAQDIESSAEKLSVKDFQLQIELLKAAIDKLIAEIQQIRSSFPFNIENDLRNEDWVNRQNKQTELLIKQELERKKKYEERIDLLKSV